MFHDIMQIIEKRHYEEPKGFGDEVIQYIISYFDKILHIMFYQNSLIFWIATLHFVPLAMTEILYVEIRGASHVS